jgi:hypothetical protein
MSDSRAEFESFISLPPHEKEISRFPEDGSSAWPGSYKNLIVDLAWDAWQASREALSSCSEIPNSSDPDSRQALEGEQLEVWLGNGDKSVADIYAEDGSYAGIGIFQPENGRTGAIGQSDGEIDGRPLDEVNAIVLIKSTRPESLQVVVEELQEAMAKMEHTHPASAAKQAVSVPSILYDGYAVFQEVQHARNSKCLENIKDSALVSDVLDAVVKLIKQEQDDE